MNADLVLSSGLQLKLHLCVRHAVDLSTLQCAAVSGGVMPVLLWRVIRVVSFSECITMNLHGLRMLEEPCLYPTLFVLYFTLKDSHILSLQHSLIPVFLKRQLGVMVLCEYNQSGCVPVESVDDEQFSEMLFQYGICRGLLFASASCGDGEKS